MVQLQITKNSKKIWDDTAKIIIIQSHNYSFSKYIAVVTIVIQNFAFSYWGQGSESYMIIIVTITRDITHHMTMLAAIQFIQQFLVSRLSVG